MPAATGASYDKAAVRRTRRDLADRVRDDWDEVLASALRSAADPARDAVATCFVDALEWRERTFASSDPSSAESSDSQDANLAAASGRDALHRRRTSRNAPDSPSRRLSGRRQHPLPDGPDADGNSSPDPQRSEAGLVRHVDERKRRRRRRLDRELAWNEGLRNWEATRHVWTGARRVPETATHDPLNCSSSSEATSVSSTSTMSKDDDARTDEAKLHLPYRTRLHEPALPFATRTVIQVPVPPPAIPPTDPGRVNIESQYTTIYDKVVVEGQRPQVPINLAHLVPALVKGWKAHDEWPPRAPGLGAAPLDPASAPGGGGKSTRPAVADRDRRRKFLPWSSHLGGAHKAPAHAALAAEHGTTADEGTAGSSADHDREKGTVRKKVSRMTKALRGSLSSMSEEKLL